MEQFKQKLKLENIITSLMILILLTVSALALLSEVGILPSFGPEIGDSHWKSRWRGFIMGASMGLLIFMLVGLIQSILALKNEKKLKKLYIKSNDERTGQIILCAQSAAYRICVMLGLVAVMVAGYFSITVSLTILGCVAIASLMGIVCKLYFSTKL